MAASPMPLFGGFPVTEIYMPCHHRPQTQLAHPLPETLPCLKGGAGLARTPKSWLSCLRAAPQGHYVCPSGNGDILSYEDANCAMQTGVTGIMIAR